MITVTVSLGLFLIGWLVVIGRVGWLILSKGALSGGKGFKGKGGKMLSALTRNWRELIPFLSAGAAIALAGASVGGILGGLLGWLRGKFGAFGDFLLDFLTGSQTVTATASDAKGLLTPYGAVFMLGALLLAAMAWKAASDVAKKELALGALAGITAGPFLGAVVLVPVANWLADQTVKPLFEAVVS